MDSKGNKQEEKAPVDGQKSDHLELVKNHQDYRTSPAIQQAFGDAANQRRSESATDPEATPASAGDHPLHPGTRDTGNEMPKPADEDQEATVVAQSLDRNTTMTAEDPFDPAALRLPPDYGTEVEAERMLVTVPVRRPRKNEWFRVHPGPEHAMRTKLLEDKSEGGRGSPTWYAVAPQIWDHPDVADELTLVDIHTATNRQGEVFLVPARVPKSEQDNWAHELIAAINMAKTKWMRVKTNFPRGYIVLEGQAQPKPEFPTESLDQLLRLAFKHHYITGPDHPVIRRLRGDL